MENLKTFTLTLILCVKIVIPVPISVPVDNSYPVNPSYNSQQSLYDDNTSARRPNSYFNRLPPFGYQAQGDDVASGGSNNDDDYDDQQTDKPVPISSSNQQNINYNDLFNTNFLLNENRVKKKRRIRRPCIPIQSFGSQLFSNRLKREVNYDADGKTLNYLLGGLNNNFYPPPYYQPQSQYPSQYADNVKPQYDTPGLGQVQYQPSSGYPCVPVSFGQKPGGGLFGGSGLFGGGGSGFLGVKGQDYLGAEVYWAKEGCLIALDYFHRQVFIKEEEVILKQSSLTVHRCLEI